MATRFSEGDLQRSALAMRCARRRCGWLTGGARSAEPTRARCITESRSTAAVRRSLPLTACVFYAWCVILAAIEVPDTRLGDTS